MTRRMVLLLALLGAMVAFLLVESEYYFNFYRSLGQGAFSAWREDTTASPALTQSPPPVSPAESSAPGMSTPPTQIREETTVSVIPRRPTERIKRIELDGIRNGKIAFDHHVVNTVAGSVPEEDIWTVNPNGSDRAELTANSRDWDQSPAWSPDGERIAFLKIDPVAEQPNLYGKLYVMNTDGSNKVALPRPTGVSPFKPTWSPDGERIAFMSTGDCGLYITQADGSSTPKKLSIPSLSDCGGWPTWSPDGSEMAFTGNRGNSGWSDIYVIKVSPEGDTSDLRQLTDHPMGDEEPSWSPDGTEIAFSSNRVRGGEIYKIDVNSLRETRLTHNGIYDLDHEPTWSPDGEQIAYVKEMLKSVIPTASIYTMNSDGSNPTPVFEAPGEMARHPDWGPRP